MKVFAWVFCFIVSIASMLYGIYVFQTLYNWFIASALDVINLTFLHAWGITVALGVLYLGRHVDVFSRLSRILSSLEKDDDQDEKLTQAYGKAIGLTAGYGASHLIGWLIHCNLI